MKQRILPFLTIIFFSFCLSCSSSSNTSEPSSQSATTSQKEVEDAAQYSLASMDDNANDAQDIQKLYDVSENIGLGESQAAIANRTALGYLPAATTTFPCGTLEYDEQTFTVVFDGSCDTISSGTIGYDSSGTVGDKLYTMDFSEVVYGDCTIDGSADTQFSATADMISWTYSLNQMAICGQQYDGTVTLNLDPNSGEITYELYSQNYAYQSGSISVETDIDYSDVNGISGNATVTINGKNYQCIAANIVVDKTCGVPIKGTLTVQGADGNTAIFDFKDTTCENKTVLYTLNGETHTYDLGETAEMIIQAS